MLRAFPCLCQVCVGPSRVRGEPAAGRRSQRQPFDCLSPSRARSPTIILAGLTESNTWKLNSVEEIKCVEVILAGTFSLNRSLLQRSHEACRNSWDTATTPPRPTRHCPASVLSGRWRAWVRSPGGILGKVRQGGSAIHQPAVVGSQR